MPGYLKRTQAATGAVTLIQRFGSAANLNIHLHCLVLEVEEQGMTYLAATSPDTALGPLQAAACTYRIALGPRAGQQVLRLQTVPDQPAQPTP